MLLQAVKRNIIDVAIVLALTATELLLYFLGAPEDIFNIVTGFALAWYVVTFVRVIAEYTRLRRVMKIRRIAIMMADMFSASLATIGVLDDLIDVIQSTQHKKPTEAPKVPPDGEPLGKPLQDCKTCPGKDKCNLSFKEKE